MQQAGGSRREWSGNADTAAIKYPVPLISASTAHRQHGGGEIVPALLPRASIGRQGTSRVGPGEEGIELGSVLYFVGFAAHLADALGTKQLFRERLGPQDYASYPDVHQVRAAEYQPSFYRGEGGGLIDGYVYVPAFRIASHIPDADDGVQGTTGVRAKFAIHLCQRLMDIYREGKVNSH